MVAYKVVREENGEYVSCLNVNPTRRRGSNYIPSRVYRIGHITRAYPHTPGIFCFDSLSAAESFLCSRCANDGEWDTILKVDGLGNASTRVIQLSKSFRPTFDALFNFCFICGAVLFPAVRVLEETDS